MMEVVQYVKTVFSNNIFVILENSIQWENIDFNENDYE